MSQADVNTQEDALHRWRKDIEAFLPPHSSVSSHRQAAQEPALVEIRFDLPLGGPFSLKLSVQPHLSLASRLKS